MAKEKALKLPLWQLFVVVVFHQHHQHHCHSDKITHHSSYTSQTYTHLFTTGSYIIKPYQVKVTVRFILWIFFVDFQCVCVFISLRDVAYFVFFLAGHAYGRVCVCVWIGCFFSLSW